MSAVVRTAARRTRRRPCLAETMNRDFTAGGVLGSGRRFYCRKDVSCADFLRSAARPARAAVAAAVVASTASAAAPDPATVFGALHPLFVHLPVGLLFVAAGAAVLRRLRGDRRPSPVAAVALRVGAVGAVLAAASGWIAGAAGRGPASAETLENHRIFGVVTAVLAAAAWACDAAARRAERGARDAHGLRGARFVALLGAALAAGGAGNFGGTLTHGSGFWTEPFRTAAAAPASAEAGMPLDGEPEGPAVAASAPFAIPDDVASSFAKSCVSCHGPAKKKGDLRLDDVAHVFGAEESAWTVRPGDPDASELLRRVKLSVQDEGAMPPDGARLGADEIAALARWIAEGCRAPAAPAPEKVAAAVSVRAAPEPPYAGPRGPLSPVEAAAVERLRAAGMRVEPAAADGAGLEVNLAVAARPVDAAALAPLADVARRVVEINAAGSTLDDAALDLVARCENLRRLHLQGTAVRDAGVASLAALPRLVSLNLYDTRVTDAAVDALAASPSLRRVYLWKTAATPDAMARLRATRDDLRVEGGVEAFEPAAASK